MDGGRKHGFGAVPVSPANLLSCVMVYAENAPVTWYISKQPNKCFAQYLSVVLIFLLSLISLQICKEYGISITPPTELPRISTSNVVFSV